jgi:hypothetical protein
MIDFYRSRFPACNFVLYDNYSTDNTVNIAKANNIEIIQFDTNDKFSDLKHIEIKNNCWKSAKTDWVLTCDMDELLDINEKQLKSEELSGVSLIKSEGYNMVNMPGFNRLEDVRYGERTDRYDKPYLFNKKYISEINYDVGCHGSNPIGRVVKSDTSYKAYHYRFISEQMAIKRYKSYSYRLSDENLKNGWGKHYLKSDEELIVEFESIRKNAIKLIQ